MSHAGIVSKLLHTSTFSTTWQPVLSFSFFWSEWLYGISPVALISEAIRDRPTVNNFTINHWKGGTGIRSNCDNAKVIDLSPRVWPQGPKFGGPAICSYVWPTPTKVSDINDNIRKVTIQRRRRQVIANPIKSEWVDIQISKNHQFFTVTSIFLVDLEWQPSYMHGIITQDRICSQEVRCRCNCRTAAIWTTLGAVIIFDFCQSSGYSPAVIIRVWKLEDLRN